jgi:hypothetical protein
MVVELARQLKAVEHLAHLNRRYSVSRLKLIHRYRPMVPVTGLTEELRAQLPRYSCRR